MTKTLGIYTSFIALILLTMECQSNDKTAEEILIRSITINNQDIFNLYDNRENGLFYRLANKLHTRTKARIIKDQLLFIVGDTYSERLISESEKILRSNRFVRSAEITVTKDGNWIDVLVTTHDTWSTKPKFSFSRKGNNNKSEFGLQEENLFGLGVSIGLAYKKDIDRNSTVFRVSDKHVLGTWYQADVEYANNSDGFTQRLTVAKPFYSLDTRMSHGFSISNDEREEALYYDTDKYFTFAQDVNQFDSFWGWSSGFNNGAVIRHRTGFHIDDKSYLDIPQTFQIDDPTVAAYVKVNDLLPENVEEVYPYYAFDYLEDQYIKTTNFNKIRKVEDRYIGLTAGFLIGYSDANFGSTYTNYKFHSYLSNVFELSDTSSFAADFALDFRVKQGAIENLISDTSLKYYKSQSDKFKFYADFNSVSSHRLDKDKQIVLDGSTGLRGYPAHYLSGENYQKLTVEQRYYSRANPLRLFNYGAAIFFDAARITGGTPFERQRNGVYSNIGIGFRIANNRSSIGDIVHIDIAMPIQQNSDIGRYQISIESKTTF